MSGRIIVLQLVASLSKSYFTTARLTKPTNCHKINDKKSDLQRILTMKDFLNEYGYPLERMKYDSSLWNNKKSLGSIHLMVPSF